MKTTGKIVSFTALAAIVIGLFIFMKQERHEISSEGYIGRSTIAVEDGKMGPEALLALGRMSDPQVSPDGKHILYGVSYTSVEENRSVRNLYICNLDGSDNQALTTAGKSVSNARWSNDGKKIIFLYGGQIWTADIKNGRKGWNLKKYRKVSEVGNGIGEFKISPDGKKVMYVSYIKSAVKSPSDCYSDLDKATAYTTDDLMYRHWDHTVMEIPHTFVAEIDTENGTMGAGKDILEGEKELYELPTEPFGGLEQLSWSPDSRFIAYSCRKAAGKKYAFSTNTEIYIYNIKTGQTEIIEMGGGYDTDPVWSPDGTKLCWISMERDGYEADKQRLIVAEISMPETGGSEAMPKVGQIQDITVDFKYNVSSPVWASDSKAIWFASLAEGLQGIFRAYEDAESWEIERITADDMWYDFGSPFHVAENENGTTTLYTTWCSMDFPTELVAVTIGKDGKAETGKPAIKAECPVIADAVSYKQITDENGHILSQLAEHDTEARYVKTVDGKDMLTWVLYPPQFDPSKEYPFHPHLSGRPAGHIEPGLVIPLELPSDGIAGIRGSAAEPSWNDGVRPGLDRADFRRLPWSEHAGLPRGS